MSTVKSVGEHDTAREIQFLENKIFLVPYHGRSFQLCAGINDLVVPGKVATVEVEDRSDIHCVVTPYPDLNLIRFALCYKTTEIVFLSLTIAYDDFFAIK